MEDAAFCVMCKKRFVEPGYFVCYSCFKAGLVACRACHIRPVDGKYEFCQECWNTRSVTCKLCANPASSGELLCTSCWNRATHCPICRVAPLDRGWDLCRKCFRSGTRLCIECREPLSLSKRCTRCAPKRSATAAAAVMSSPEKVTLCSTTLDTSASSKYSNTYSSAPASAYGSSGTSKKLLYDDAQNLIASPPAFSFPLPRSDSTSSYPTVDAKLFSESAKTSTESNTSENLSFPPFDSSSSTCQIPADELEINFGVPPLGSGAFGRVLLAKYNKAPVAVKVLHFTTPELLREVLKEAAMLRTLTDRGHPNVVRFFGICQIQAPFYSWGIVTEFVPNGSLKNFLVNHRSELKAWQLVNFAKGTAAGMLHLSSHKPPVLHRDLSAKNILVGQREEDGSYVLRVADFGLSRINEGYSITSSSICPVRWTAPEVWTKQRIYTVASDVWAFGVCLWEIMTFGQQPYLNLTDAEVKDHLRKGTLVLDPHPLIPPTIFDLIKMCCQTDPKDRPDFAKLYNSLETIEIVCKSIV